MNKKKWTQMTKVGQLEYLLSHKETRFMIEHIDEIGGRLSSETGNKKCNIFNKKRDYKMKILKK